MESYSQCGQDLFVLNFSKIKNGTFLDLGCYLPKNINNTFLLEENGWIGVSLDINDYNEQWKSRKTPFIQKDCFTLDYKEFLPQYYSGDTIDYLTLDMERLGDRYKLLKIIIETGYKFKIITIEHDSHLGNDFVENEKIPQRKLLQEKGYILLCSDVSHKDYSNDYYEDWWINPNFFEKEQYETWFSDKENFDEIFKKQKINYTINDISKTWY